MKESKYGISPEQLNEIVNLIAKTNVIRKIVIFGSRAKGNYEKGSDIDLALFGDNVELNDLLELSVKIDQLELPYKIDLVNYNRISNPDLKDHIDRNGEVLLEKLK